MNGFLSRQLCEITSALETAGGRLIVSVVLALLSVVLAIAGLAFLAIALFLKVAAIAGAVYAALVVGGAFIFLALVGLLILRLRRPALPSPVKKTPAKVQNDAETVERRAAYGANIDETVAPLLSALHESGLQNEERALRIGAELSKQTGGFGLVALALAGGFIIARRFGIPGKR